MHKFAFRDSTSSNTLSKDTGVTQDNDDPTVFVPKDRRPDQNRFSFDLDQALRSVVGLRINVPETAHSAENLGTERQGHGVVIDPSGLILTIGYLVLEAESIWIITDDGRAEPGHVAGYDQATGFGLVQALATLNLPALPLGESADLIPGDDVILAGVGGIESALAARVTGRREFAGYWEYLIDDAIFTQPAHPLWGGSALIGEDGTLRGIGSLFVQEGEDASTEGNMIVPIDLLKPILETLRTTGSSGNPPRPWLGTFTADASGRVIIVGTWDEGPADQAGIQVGDLVVGVDDKPVSSMVQFFKRVWALGDAGVDVPITVYRNGELETFIVESTTRGAFQKGPDLH